MKECLDVNGDEEGEPLFCVGFCAQKTVCQRANRRETQKRVACPIDGSKSVMSSRVSFTSLTSRFLCTEFLGF